MIDPVTTDTGVVIIVLLPKALEKVGEKIGETAGDKSGEAIQSVRETVQAKLKTVGTAELLTQAEANPTEANMHAGIASRNCHSYARKPGFCNDGVNAYFHPLP